ncbi:MAG: hypothetical protein EA421_10700 [Gemmatimonadales bacterium]|nr:MAG: hypothetical protein EA421_10700 [Gemmatimonadales bacterium]
MDEERSSPSDHGSDDGRGTLQYGVPPDGARLPPDTRLGPVRLQVADLARSLSYYQDVLGLRVLETEGAEAVLGTSMAPDGDSAHLSARGEPVGASDHRVSEALYHQALGLDEVVWSYPGALFLSAGGYHHHLGLNTWAAGAPHSLQAVRRSLSLPPLPAIF